MNYQVVLDMLMNINEGAPFQDKKNALRNVAEALNVEQNNDGRLRLKAFGTIAALDIAGNRPEAQIGGWVNAEIRDYKQVLEEVIAQQPAPVVQQENVNMAVDGGRKKRRTKKSKKTRRYTRRW